jgi:transcriptional regulator with XRE-family HTH domain
MPKPATKHHNTERRKAFATSLANAMSVRGVVQRQFATDMGVSQGSVSGWVGGEYEPLPDVVFAIESKLDLPPGHLSRHLGYVPLDAAVPSITLEEAVLADPDLDNRFKKALLASLHAYKAPLTGVRRKATPAPAERRARAPRNGN